MKLVAYQTEHTEGLGAVLPDGRIAVLPWPDFDALLRETDPTGALDAIDIHNAPVVENARRLPPTVRRPHVIGTGGNYPDHAKEASVEIDIVEPVFVPFLWGAIIGPDDDIRIPTPDTLTDYEVELAIVIGRKASRLTRENAMEHVFGYTIVNDVSARNVTKRERMQMMLSKSPDTFLPIGPHVVTADEIADPGALKIRSYVNGVARQNSSTANMSTGIADLLVTVTESVTLHPGDILTTGTPGGVGYFRTPPEFVHPGDTVSVEVESIGRMDNRVTAGWA
ncbi:2-keto-4-pentenoate hydratase/2-oxohepta-3-ene-1,7-dioic acid hydratase in catechol pathway [Rhodococcus sp. 27YEA15]|uniref:fumarylacetoacetate hydrolase family protein n=1 Tax=Rhodococcus sp. 27YEA15 TaxID=3156259 RepID=UPI003C7CCEE7